MITTITAIVVFALTLAFLIAIRTRAGNKLEFKNSEIVLALIPVALWLILSGKIQEFTFGDFKIVAAIREASRSPVASLVTDLGELPIERVEVGPKASVTEIPRLIERRTQALTFRLGHGGYWGPAISAYFETLTQYPFFRYIVINNPDGSFFGLTDARQLNAVVQSPSGELYLRNLANWLNTADRQQLAKLPGFLSSDNAIRNETDRRNALQLMNSLDTEALPVIDEDDKFIGIVERSKLTASILIDVSEKIERI